MAIRSINIAQRDFSAGQLDATSERREDTRIFRAGLRTARNVRILNSGAVKVRPGRRWVFKSEPGSITGLVRPVPGEWWWCEFAAGNVTFRRRAPSATAPQVFAAKPWTAAQSLELRFEMSGSTLIVCHQSFRPWTFSYDWVTQTWVEAPFVFASDPSGELREPYRNFNGGQGITLQPSARTGAVTVTFSQPVLNAAHVGVRFRYGDQQLRITAVTSSTVGSAVCLTQLPPTYDVTFASVEGLQLGDPIEGVTSGVRAIVLSITGLVARVFVSRNWVGFAVNELAAGPRWKSSVTAQSAVLAPGAVVLWDEAFCSDYRGWPGSVTVDQQRVIFCKFKQFGPAILWSSIATLNDFRVGADADDSIFEFVPNASSVQEVLGGPDEFVLTDTGIYFIPISSASPLQPGSIDFRLITDIGAAPVRPVLTADGFVFINASLSRVIAVTGTGQAARPYISDDTTQFHSSLIKNPVAMAVTSSDVSAPERYLYVVNADGTLAVGKYERRVTNDNWVGWVPWDGAGRVRWVATGGSDVALVCEYDTSVGLCTSIETLDDGLILDASIPATASFNPAASAYLTGTEVSLESVSWYRGEIMSPVAGTIAAQVPDPLPIGTRLGKAFSVEVEPFVPHADPGQDIGQRMNKRRVKQIAVRLLQAQAIEIAGRAFPYYEHDENQELPPPIRDVTYNARLLGRDNDPRWSLKRVLPGALTILEMTTTVTI